MSRLKPRPTKQQGEAGVEINVVSEKTQRDSPKSTAAKCALRLRGRAALEQRR
jgi:hypothetical protein